MPYDSDDNDVACKYPFNSVALLCADIKEITELLFEATIINTFGEANELKQFAKSFEFCNFEIISSDENITKEYNVIQHFFSFLENKHNNCDDVLCGYFYQIFRFLIEKEKEIIIDILFNKDKHHIKNMINLTHNTSICKCIAEILNKNYQHKQKYISYKTYICNQLLTNKIYKKENIKTICEDIFIPLFSNNSVYLTSTMNTNINFKEFYFVSFFTKLKVIKVTHRSIAKMCYMIANAIIEGIEFGMNETVQNNIINNNTNNNDFTVVNSDSNVEIDKQKYICKTLYNNKKEVIEFLTETSHSFIDYITNNNYNNYFDIIYITDYLVQFFCIIKYYTTNDSNSNSNNNTIQNENESEYKCSNSIVKNIFTEKLYLTFTVKLLENPNNNIYHTAYIDLITSIKDHSDILINKIIINKFMTYLVDIYPKHRELLAPIVRILAIIFENYDCNIDTYKEDSFKNMCYNLKKFADSVNALFLENPVQSKDDLENDEEGNVVMKKPLIVHEHTLNDLINNGIKQYLKSGCDEEEVESENISEFVENDNNNNMLNKNNTDIEESEIEECISIEEDINETNVNQEPQIEVKDTETVIEYLNVNVNSG